MADLIKIYSLRKAHTTLLFALMNAISDRLKEEDVEQLNLSESLIAFDKELKELGKAIRQKRKTILTSQINKTDKVRCNIVRGLIYHLKGTILMPNDKKAAMAKQLLNIIKKYGNYIEQLSMNEKTGIIETITGTLQQEKYKASVQQLHLESDVAELIKTNELYLQYYTQRSKIMSNYVVGLTKTKRKAMLFQFYELCNVINANALIYGAKPYQKLANIINLEIAKTREKIKARRSKAQEK